MQPLFEHQKATIKFCAENPRVFDMSDPGTGKTRAHIEAFAATRSRGGGPALVVAPKSLLRTAWEADTRKYAPWMKVAIAQAPEAKRLAAFKSNADMYVTNHDAVIWLSQHPEILKQFKGGTLIVDESGAFKHATSKRSKAMKKVKAVFDIRRLLNGTPNTNGVCDIWNQVNLLDDGQRLGVSFFAFQSQVCTPVQVGPRPEMRKWVEKPESVDAVAYLIKDLTIRHDVDKCLDLPENITYSMNFVLSDKHRRTYEQMRKMEMALLDDGVVTAINAASVINKLLQIASGAVYDENGDYHLVDSERYDLVLDLAEQRRHSVVFFNWRHQRDYLIKACEARGLTFGLLDGTVTQNKREEAVTRFQAGFYRILLAQPQSAAHGLTLTKGTATIWASPTYNLEHWMQGNRRIHRAGQTVRTETISVLAKDTIEQDVHARCMGKLDPQMNLLEIMTA
jgi:SNF2 family DNA or RNA helicase